MKDDLRNFVETPDGLRHYAFARIYSKPPPRRAVRSVSAPPRPVKVDARLFYVDRIRPASLWPPICRKMNLPAFDSLDAGRRWLASFKTSDNIKEHIACDFCRKIHIDCFPSEVSGMSSGKSVRHEQHVSIFDR